MAHRGAADVETACDFGFAYAGAAQFADLIGMQSGGKGSAQTFAVLSGMGETSPNALAQDLALELGEHGQQCGHGTAGRRGQIQRLGQRDEADAEMLQFLQGGQQIGDRSSPSVQPPHQHHIDFPAPRGFHQLLPHLPL